MKLVHLICFIIRIYHDARSPERQILQRSLRTETYRSTQFLASLLNIVGVGRSWFDDSVSPEACIQNRIISKGVRRIWNWKDGTAIAVRRMKTRTKNEKQQNQATDSLNVQLDVNDLARYGELISPATVKRTQIFMQIARYFCLI